MSPAPRILAIGDSLIAGYGLNGTDSFPAQLEAALQATHVSGRVINASVSGDKTADVRRRLPGGALQASGAPCACDRPGRTQRCAAKLPPAQTRENLSVIVIELRRWGVPVLLTTVEPPEFLRERTRDYARLHNKVAAEHGAAICGFFPPGVLGHADMVLWDRVHPNIRAIAAVTRAMLPAVAGLIDHPVVATGSAA